MIARIWRGAVRVPDGDAYAAYIAETGLAGYVQTPGNRGAWMPCAHYEVADLDAG